MGKQKVKKQKKVGSTPKNTAFPYSKHETLILF